MPPARTAIVLKGYPRLSETFIAQELLALEQRGLPLAIWSLRRPTDAARHPLHDAIRAPVAYLPEYLHQAPLSTLRAFAWAMSRPGLGALVSRFWRDLRRDPSAARLRRLGQGLILARALPDAITHLHAHFLHAPSSVARYAALLTGRGWSFSAHAKDIWTTPDWDLSEKIAEAAWGVTCTRDGLGRLDALGGRGRVHLAYHGLDLSRFPAPLTHRPARDGSDTADPVTLLCVGRLVAKKGHDDLVDALAALPAGLHWRLILIGGGELRAALQARVTERGLSGRVTFRGALAQPAVVDALRNADLFVLPAKAAPGGDRDGLPNVLMEAASQRLAIVATQFAGTPEFLTHETDALLVPPGDAAALGDAIGRLVRDPGLRARLAEAAYRRLVRDFSMEAGIDLIAGRLAGGAPAVPSASDPREACSCGC
ncbi:MAG: glycosyltransferase family 4 protein [Thermoleophilia bacterium]|jgi:glycosyltransferase involved in cell wall biosynthesis|nr:glycosyltransferase family 4 protein [Beijerinckiaceae bacterium]MBY0361899.1 glycosyltransferase family 4 protein [Phreatobacter sp.]MBY0398071.1 glycosyltransferase family 4 protein [Thermoleophilia bacterium]